MNENTITVLELMKRKSATIDDLQASDDSIEATGKFPWEVYFSDKSISCDVEHYCKGEQRIPIGVVIGSTMYALPDYVGREGCGRSKMYCREAFPFGFIGTLPNEYQVMTLTDNLDTYNQIAVFLKHKKLGKMQLAIAHGDNSSNRQHYYDMKTRVEGYSDDFTPTLPVINL